MMYQIRTVADMTFIYHTDLGVIPADEMNIDYQAYLAWVAEGNTAEEWQPEINEEQ